WRQMFATKSRSRNAYSYASYIDRGARMARISIARKHRLSHKKAKDAADKIARDLKSRFALDYAWDGDRIDFERPGVTGCMHVRKDQIDLDVSLTFLLTPLKPAIEREIHAQLDRLLGDKATSGKA